MLPWLVAAVDADETALADVSARLTARRDLLNRARALRVRYGSPVTASDLLDTAETLHERGALRGLAARATATVRIATPVAPYEVEL